MALWGKTDAAASVPKYLSDADKDRVYFVDTTEASVAANKAKGLGTGGWNLYTTYTDANGATRHRAENLVAMGVSAGDAGDTGAIVLNAATQLTDGVDYQIVTVGTTDFTAIGAANNDVGTVFTAANTVAAAAGTGTVRPLEDDTVADS
jgi:hypothetical protein